MAVAITFLWFGYVLCGTSGDEALTQLADSLDGADQLVTAGEKALMGAAEPNAGRGARVDNVSGQQR
jgi:hypothetical protein